MILAAPHATIHRRRGLTLVECLMACTILATVVLATSSTGTVARQHLREGAAETNAVRLARDLMEEISSKSYANPDGTDISGPEADETARSMYDDVNDYAGYSDGPTGIKDAAGASYPSELQCFTRTVTVTSDTDTVLGTAIAGQTVTLTLTGNGRTWTFTKLFPQPQ